MKKIVFALIAVLLLGTFVACDGEADFLLWDDEPVDGKTITLRLSEYIAEERCVTFVLGDPEALEKSFTIPDSVSKWEDLIELGYCIPIYDYESSYYSEDPYSFECDYCFWEESTVMFASSNASLSLQVAIDNNPVSVDELIDFSKTYTLR